MRGGGRQKTKSRRMNKGRRRKGKMQEWSNRGWSEQRVIKRSWRRRKKHYRPAGEQEDTNSEVERLRRTRREKCGEGEKRKDEIKRDEIREGGES